MFCLTIWDGGGSNNSEFIYLKIVYFFLHVYKPVTFKVLSIGCNATFKMFFLLLKAVFEFVIFMHFSACALFVSPLPHQQNVSLAGLFFIWRNRKKVAWDEMGWIGRVGHGGHAIFGQKLLNPQRGVGRWPIYWNGQIHWESSEKFTEAKCSLSQQHQLLHWYR